MDDTKLEELEKAYKKEKHHKVRARMVAVRMVCVRNLSMNETVDIQGRSPNLVRNWLRRYDEGGLEGLRDLPRCGRPRRILRIIEYDLISSRAMDRIPLPSCACSRCKEGKGIRSGKMVAEFHSMMPRLYHEMFDTLHRAFGDSPGVRPSTRMADFEVLGRSITGHVGYGAGKFVESLRLALDSTMPDAS